MSTEQLRPIVFFALCFVGILLWQAWEKDHAQKPQEAPAPTGESYSPEGTATKGTPIPGIDVPVVPESNSSSSDTVSTPGDGPATTGGGNATGINVNTDLYRARILLEGGTLASVRLLKYPVSLEATAESFPLLAESGAKLFTAQSGLVGEANAPNHHAIFESERSSYALDGGADELRVNLVWQGEGVRVTKSYLFKRDSYEIEIKYRVKNDNALPWTGRAYAQFRRVAPNESRGLGTIYTYTGGVLSSPDKPYEKYDFSDMEDQDLNRDITGGWIAMIQHYFAAAWIPDSKVPVHYYSKSLPASQFVLGMVTPAFSVATGASGQTSVKLYVGPKIQDRLQSAVAGLERTVDYGWLFFIAEPLYIGLQYIYGVLGNWGWSIIILTFLIKLLFFPLSNASYKSMARMRKLAPKMKSLKERFGDDRQKLNQAMMEMYKKEKINPLGGCLPIVVQIPVFISLYWVLLETVELRQAPFMFWLNDLSTKDPYYVLPVLMGISMFAQQRLSPAPPDPIQAKVMMAMPVVFTFFFLAFPSGLVLYWLCNNLLSISQQWMITRRIESGAMK